MLGKLGSRGTSMVEDFSKFHSRGASSLSIEPPSMLELVYKHPRPRLVFRPPSSGSCVSPAEFPDTTVQEARAARRGTSPNLGTRLPAPPLLPLSPSIASLFPPSIPSARSIARSRIGPSMKGARVFEAAIKRYSINVGRAEKASTPGRVVVASRYIFHAR